MSVLATDSFTRADSGTTQVENLGANWTTNKAGKFYKLVSNAVQIIDTVNDGVERYSSVSWPDDQYAKVTLSTAAVTLGTGYGPGCRWDTGGANTGYRLVGATGGYELLRFNAGVSTVLVSSAATALASGDTLKLECTGSATVTLRMYKNDVQFGGDQTDSSASRLTSGAAAMCYSSTAALAIVDTFEGGDFLTAAQIVAAYMQDGQSWSQRYV